MRVRAVRVNGIVRVFFEDCSEIRLADLASLREEAMEFLAWDGDVIVDLAGLRFIDSAGLGLLVGMLRHAREQGRRLVFAGIEPAVMQVMRVIGLDRILELFPRTRVAEQVLCRRQTA